MYEERVQRGAALLDSYFGGHDWRGDLDPEDLDLAEWSGCVLAQVFGNFDAGMADLDLNEEEATSCGFFLPDDQVCHYGNLTAEWLTYLER